MDKRRSSFAKHFRKNAVALLTVAALLSVHQPAAWAASTLAIDGSASVSVRTCSVEHSVDALASVRKEGEDKVVLYANLSQPSEWACFTFTVENVGSVDARLTDVIGRVDAPSDLLVSFGITEKDVGEVLKAGERCELSIVVQLDPEKEDSLASSGDFALTLVYEASAADDGACKDEGNEAGAHKPPQTGDHAYLIPAIGCLLFSMVLLLPLIKRRREKNDSNQK